MMKRLSISILFAALLAGCGDPTGSDLEDEKNPHVRQGLEQAKNRQWDAAIEQFNEALASSPDLARPDLELALIYQQQKKNYIRAVYHYERYLEKRPDSQKAPLIAGWIRQAKISLVAEIGQSSDGVSEELIRLTRENNLLRKQLAQSGTSAPQVSNVKTIVTTPPAKKPAPRQVAQPKPKPAAKPIQRIQPPAPKSGTYTVLPGDSLIRISKAVYGDGSKWRKIYEANLNQMESENDLKVGQVLRIPTL